MNEPQSPKPANFQQQLVQWGCQGIKLANQALDLATKIPASLTTLMARLAIAPVFWTSGRLKVTGWFDLSPVTVFQFRDEFGLPFPALMANMAAMAEHIFPIMLILGLGTRFAAAGLLAMTIVIQILVPGGWWSFHALWFALLLYLLREGGGRIALDPYVPGVLAQIGARLAQK